MENGPYSTDTKKIQIDFFRRVNCSAEKFPRYPIWALVLVREIDPHKGYVVDEMSEDDNDNEK